MPTGNTAMRNTSQLKARKAELEQLEAAIELKVALWKNSSAQLLRNNIYVFVREVDDETVFKAKTELALWSAANRGKPLTIILSSPGGVCTAGLALLDVLNGLGNSGHHLTVKVRGMAASMGSILLQAGKKGNRRRLVGEHAKVLIHPPWAWYDAPMSAVQLQHEASETRILWKQLCGILANDSECPWTADELEAKVAGNDWWLTAEEAVRYGFADEIG
jgi:ATP-dependent Clp endopeptidase proteolytic subunit ClpP